MDSFIIFALWPLTNILEMGKVLLLAWSFTNRFLSIVIVLWNNREASVIKFHFGKCYCIFCFADLEAWGTMVSSNIWKCCNTVFTLTIWQLASFTFLILDGFLLDSILDSLRSHFLQGGLHIFGMGFHLYLRLTLCCLRLLASSWKYFSHITLKFLIVHLPVRKVYQFLKQFWLW